MDFDKILLKAPSLMPMIYEAYQLQDRSYRVKNNYWYKVLKPRMLRCVGFSAEDPELATSEIYDKVYHFFIELMEI